jgi:hypothetical protein
LATWEESTCVYSCPVVQARHFVGGLFGYKDSQRSTTFTSGLDLAHFWTGVHMVLKAGQLCVPVALIGLPLTPKEV